ncbi:hypothetical protein HPB52_023361 [Rhipicephalus sanguineus]|uniref:Uncharacterized protein n=1 Tax=Rhipicephalus sanguineus TaxID=34632 RepID=A0A9D4QBJ8_RHISA|nr:hypothetical protein HPB52_023361 [Rhipicephalus sanguineus]
MSSAAWRRHVDGFLDPATRRGRHVDRHERTVQAGGHVDRRAETKKKGRHVGASPSNKAVPRADKELTATSTVCDLHFHQQDILKTYVHVIDGKSVEIPRGKWSLAKDAVPKVFPNLPAYLSKPPEKKRKPRCKSAKRPADQASEQRQDCINFGHYRLLHNTEKAMQLKVVPKLTSSHVNPGKLEKMCVRLATQLLSRSVAIGLKFYREQQYPGFEDTQGTENFTLLMNNIFDALNAKCPITGIYKNSPKIKVIQDFLGMLNTTERTSRLDNTRMFASQMTMESLRVTLMSVLDIITFLHSRDVPYVLTAKLNQDPLERFFGVVRSFGGDEDHPTITHFGQIFRLLSLYTPLKMATKGNCSGEADPVLVAVHESLSDEKAIALSKKEARVEELSKQTTPHRLEPDATVPPPGDKHRNGATCGVWRQRRASKMSFQSAQGIGGSPGVERKSGGGMGDAITREKLYTKRRKEENENERETPTRKESPQCSRIDAEPLDGEMAEETRRGGRYGEQRSDGGKRRSSVAAEWNH